MKGVYLGGFAEYPLCYMQRYKDGHVHAFRGRIDNREHPETVAPYLKCIIC